MGPDAPAALNAVSASPNAGTISDPLAAASAAFASAFDALDTPETPEAEASGVAAESASETAPAATQEQATEQVATSETDTQAADTPEKDATTETEKTAEPALALKPKDEAALAAWREKDPEAYRDIQRRLQGIEDRAAQRALDRIKREQTVAGVTEKASDSGLQTTYEEMAPDERAAWVETLPEFTAARAALATDIAAITGVEPAAFTPDVLADPEAMAAVLLSGSVAQRLQSAAVKAAVDKQLKDAEEAGYRRGKAEIRSSGVLPQSSDAAKPSLLIPKTPEDAFAAFRSGLDLIAQA